MDDKLKDTVNNICTVLGAALLLKPVIDQAAKTLAPELQKLTSDETAEKLALLADGKQDAEHKQGEKHSDTIEELERKLAELKGQSASSDSHDSQDSHE